MSKKYPLKFPKEVSDFIIGTFGFNTSDNTYFTNVRYKKVGECLFEELIPEPTEESKEFVWDDRKAKDWGPYIRIHEPGFEIGEELEKWKQSHTPTEQKSYIPKDFKLEKREVSHTVEKLLNDKVEEEQNLDGIAVFIEKYRNDISMTSHRIAAHITGKFETKNMFTQQQLDEAIEKAFNVAREGRFVSELLRGSPYEYLRYKTFDDYKQSLNQNKQQP